MQKYYCEYCRLIYDEMRKCKKCGREAEKQIWIEVQKQTEGK